jgi:hypothetical protein
LDRENLELRLSKWSANMLRSADLLAELRQLWRVLTEKRIKWSPLLSKIRTA